MNHLQIERRGRGGRGGREVGAIVFASALLIAGGCTSKPTPTTQTGADSVASSTHLLTGRRHPHPSDGLGSAKLPSTFELSGCDADHICQLIEKDDAYSAVCDGGATVLDLTVTRKRAQVSVSWTGAEEAECSATLVDGQLSGSCETAAGSCEISMLPPLPSPRCVELPNHLTFSGCDLPTEECEIVQTACLWQGRCGDGSTFVGGRANSTGARWNRADGLRCTSTLENGVLTGTCAPPPPPENGEAPPAPPADAGTPESCDWTATQPADAPEPPTCDPLPSSFAVDVCGSETVCHVLQRGCIWEAHCEEDLFAGRAHDNVYEFNDGSCALTVKDGHFTGSCEDEEGSCTLTQKDPVASSTCKALPSVLELNGCGLEGECKTIQNGCVWQASCNDNAIFYNGYATELGITLNGTVGDDDAPAACQAVFDEDGTLHGGCSPLSDNVADGGTPPLACELTGTAPAAAEPSTP